MIYTVTLNPSLDYVMHIGSLNCEDVNRSSSEEFYYGGKGINVSAVLNTLNVKSTALGFVGGFTGEKLCEMMLRDGIKNDFIRLSSGDTRINVKLKSEKETDINAAGPLISESETGELFKRLNSIKKGDTLVLAGNVPNSLPADMYAQMLSKLCGKGIRFVVDATGNQLISTLKYKPFLIKPNNYELSEIFGKEIKDTDETVKYAKKLQDMGAQNVIVSRGGNGAVLIDGNGKVHIAKAVKGNVISTVGCGDSMVAGFIAGTLLGKSVSESFMLSVACASATAFSKHLASFDEISIILKSIKSEQSFLS